MRACTVLDDADERQAPPHDRTDVLEPEDDRYRGAARSATATTQASRLTPRAASAGPRSAGAGGAAARPASGARDVVTGSA